MKRFDYSVAMHELGLIKGQKTANRVQYGRIPKWVRGKDFLELFLPYLEIVGDSREQDHWVEKACAWYGIEFEWARKDETSGTENLKEGDYSFKMRFAGKTYDYIGQVAYERKGSVGELYNNCTAHKESGSERDRIQREFGRLKSYKKVVLLLQFGENLTDLIDAEFSFVGHDGHITQKSVGYTLFSAVMSWKQPNNKNFDVLQSASKERLYWLMVQDIYYYFRNEVRNECMEKGLLKGEKD